MSDKPEGVAWPPEPGEEQTWQVPRGAQRPVDIESGEPLLWPSEYEYQVQLEEARSKVTEVEPEIPDGVVVEDEDEYIADNVTDEEDEDEDED